MKNYVMDVILSRSNPLVLRQLAMGAERTTAQLAQAAAICLGRVHQPAGEPGPSLREALANGSMRLQLMLCDGKPARLEAKIRLKEERELDTDVPRLLQHLGPNIPQDIADIQQMNALFMRSSGAENRSLNQSRTACDPRRVSYDLLKVFDPEHMPQQVDLSMGTPLAVMLQGLRMDDLRNISKYASIYYYSPIRKAELIVTIAEHWTQEQLKSILTNKLSLSEYTALRQLVTGDQLSPQEADRLLPTLQALGLVISAQTGIAIAQQLVNCMDGIFGTDAEAQMLERMRLRQAFLVACLLYGVFDMSHITTLYSHLYGKEPDPDLLNRIWSPSSTFAGEINLKLLSPTVAYAGNIINKNEATSLWNRTKDLPFRRLPSPQEATQLEHDGFVPPCAAINRLHELLREHIWSYETPDALINKALIMLFKGDTPENAADKLANQIHYYSYRKQELTDEIASYLQVVRPAVPIACLGGYSITGFQQAGLGDPYQMLKQR